MSEKSGYVCPFCGEHTTMVFKTISLANCVIRHRRCLTCGQSHKTTEILMEISKSLEKRHCHFDETKLPQS